MISEAAARREERELARLRWVAEMAFIKAECTRLFADAISRRAPAAHPFPAKAKGDRNE